jgi:opacity protein-like surface antigen
MGRLMTVIHLFLFAVIAVNGQDEVGKKNDSYNQLVQKYEEMKDSLSNLNLLIPAVSSVMMNKNQLEINLFNTLLSATKSRNSNGELFELNARSTYLFNIVQLNYGISKNARWNVGMDFNLTSARIDSKTSSMFKVFGSDDSGTGRFARAITSIGPRVRWKPFMKNYRFTVQSGLLLPVMNNPEKTYLLGENQVYLQSQMLYNFTVSERVFIFSQLGFQHGFKTNDTSAKFFPSLTGYGGYYLPRNLIVFSLLNYTPFYMKDNNWNYFASALQLGGGVQYRLSENLLINGYYTNYIGGTSYPNFNSYSIGLRYVTD